MCIFLEKDAAKQEPEVKVAAESAPPVEDVFEIVMEEEEEEEEGEEDSSSSSSSSEEGCCCNLTEFLFARQKLCFYASFYIRFPFYLDDDDDDDDEDTDGDGLVDDVDPDDDNDGIMDDGKLAVYTECPNKFFFLKIKANLQF